MTLKKFLPRVAGLSVFAALFCVPSYAAEDDKFDIVGLKLGMTYAQVQEALADYDIDPSDIQETRQSYVYSDGIKNDYRTEDFLHYINAKKSIPSKRNSADSFIIYFSPPPEGGRVVGISRGVGTPLDPPTNGQYREALYEKYGPPNVQSGNTNVSQWMFGAGTMNCLGGGQIVMPMDSKNNTIILEKVFHTSGSSIRPGVFRNGRVKDLNECADFLQYRINSFGLGGDRPFTTAYAILIDVQTWVQAELAAGAMVESLRQEAIQKREGRGTKPVL